MPARILQWVRDLPNSIKAFIGIITSVIPAIILLRSNFELGVVVTGAAMILGASSFLAYVATARNRAAGFGVSNDIYRYPRLRRWAIAGICLLTALSVVAFIFRPSRYYILASLKGRKVAPHADVVIAQFDSKLASKKFEISERIRTAFTDHLQNSNLVDVTVKTIQEVVSTSNEAETVAKEANSKVVVWGWYDDAGITVNFYTPERPTTDNDVLRMKEMSWVQDPQTPSALSLQIREGLPTNISFISLFIIGSLDYQKNKYQEGHRAFDEAMNILPKNIELKNESLLHFFQARAAENDPNEIANVICEYSKSIEMNPRFVAAYNNLSIAVTKVLLAQNPEPMASSDISQISDRILPCLNKIGYENQHDLLNDAAADFFNKTLELQPDSAVIAFNMVAARWTLVDSFDSQEHVEWYEDVLDDILKKDPSIPGAHIMRAVIAFEREGRYFDPKQVEIAVREFSAASKLLPGSAELHVNLGKVYTRTEKYTEALNEFQKARQLSPNNSEPRLGIADVFMRQAQMDLALKELVTIASRKDENKSASRMAAVMESRLRFEGGDVDGAKKILQDNLSQQSDPAETEEDRVPGKNDNSLIHYLLGLLYSLNHENVNATREFQACKDPAFGNDSEARFMVKNLRDQSYSYNDTATATWCDLLQLCASGGLLPASSKCLPADVGLRIKKVFEMAQDRIAYRIYYRRKVEFGGLACPYVFTVEPKTGDLTFDTTILYRLSSRDLETSQSRPLHHFDGKVVIREIEAETSFIDQIFVTVTDASGTAHVLRAKAQALQSADNEYLILRRGDEVSVEFDGFQTIEKPTAVTITAKGFYQPAARKNAINAFW